MSTLAKGMRVQVTPSIADEYAEYAGQFVTVQHVNSKMLIAETDDGRTLYLYHDEVMEVQP